MKVPSHYVIATFQLYGPLMLTVPDYFFRMREIGRLRQTRVDRGWPAFQHLLLEVDLPIYKTIPTAVLLCFSKGFVFVILLYGRQATGSAKIAEVLRRGGWTRIVLRNVTRTANCIPECVFLPSKEKCMESEDALFIALPGDNLQGV